jgi:hypothetical protein
LIAVFADKEGRPAAPEEAHLVTVYTQQPETDSWRAEKSFSPTLDFSGPGPLNKSLRILVEQLGGCKIILAKRIAGIPYHVFVHSGFEVFESEDASEEILSAILEETKAISAAEAQDAEDPASVPTRPVPTSICGVYALDLGRMQRAHPEVSTKMALKDFLQTDFKELRLTFSHVPPWLALDVSKIGGSMLSKEAEPGIWKVIIRKS